MRSPHDGRAVVRADNPATVACGYGIGRVSPSSTRRLDYPSAGARKGGGKVPPETGGFPAVFVAFRRSSRSVDGEPGAGQRTLGTSPNRGATLVQRWSSQPSLRVNVVSMVVPFQVPLTVAISGPP